MYYYYLYFRLFWRICFFHPLLLQIQTSSITMGSMHISILHNFSWLIIEEQWMLSTEPQAAGGHRFGTFHINRSSEPGQTGPSSSATEHVAHWNTNHSAAREPLCVSYTTTTPSAPQVQRERWAEKINKRFPKYLCRKYRKIFECWWC